VIVARGNIAAIISAARRTVAMLTADGGIRLRCAKLCRATGDVTPDWIYRGVRANLPRLHQINLARAVSSVGLGRSHPDREFTLAASLRLLPKAPWLLARIAVEGRSAHLELLG
jgi:hypothetical protein